jgi:hypothetical protein
VLAPLLQKVWIPARLGNYLYDRLWGEILTLVSSRLENGEFSFFALERSNRWEIEEALRIRFCTSGQTSKLWQPGADHRDREFVLCTPMKRGDQRSKW